MILDLLAYGVAEAVRAVQLLHQRTTRAPVRGGQPACGGPGAEHGGLVAAHGGRLKVADGLPMAPGDFQTLTSQGVRRSGPHP